MIKINDKVIEKAIEDETKRQQHHVELIASENFVSRDVLQVTGSILTNKYAEGYPHHRYYSGTKYVDIIEQTAIDRLKKLFNVKYANVQPHSGSQANAAAYGALIKPGDKIMGLALDAGGHLTHGYKVSFSGTIYHGVTYTVNQQGLLDYDEIEKRAIVEKPQLIICGFSAYSRMVDFKRFREIADKVNAFLLADIAHIAGLIAAGEHPSPVGYAHVITSTTHKTLRGARGGIIMTDDPKLAKLIDKSVFPGNQGGPLMHAIAGKAVAFYEALQDQFTTYIKQVVSNAKAFAKEFCDLGVKVITGGTDTHLFTIDVFSSYNLTGKQAAQILEDNFITANKNTIPNDQNSPFVTSGIRFGTAAMTSRGYKEKEFRYLANLINDLLKNHKNNIKDVIINLNQKFPLKDSYVAK